MQCNLSAGVIQIYCDSTTPTHAGNYVQYVYSSWTASNLLDTIFYLYADIIPDVSTVTTTSISSISYTTATSGGNVSADGGQTVTDRGVCWNTGGSPTTSDSHTHDSSGTGSYSSSLTSLNSHTTYYVRAYAINSQGTSYGSQTSFTTLSYGYAQKFMGKAGSALSKIATRNSSDIAKIMSR